MAGEAAAQFNIHDAKTNLSRIIERVEHGEEIVISRAGNPVAKVIPLRRTTRTGRGCRCSWCPPTAECIRVSVQSGAGQAAELNVHVNGPRRFAGGR